MVLEKRANVLLEEYIAFVVGSIKSCEPNHFSKVRWKKRLQGIAGVSIIDRDFLRFVAEFCELGISFDNSEIATGRKRPRFLAVLKCIMTTETRRRWAATGVG